MPPDNGLEQDPGQSGPGLLQSLRNLGTTLVDLLQTRLDLLLADLEEERTRLLLILFWAAGALFFLGVGVLVLALLAVLLLWEERQIWGIVALAALFGAIGAGLAAGVRNRLRERSRLFASNVEELSKDRKELTSR